MQMNNFMRKLYDFMQGRYGVDKLNVFLILLTLLLNGIGSLMRNFTAYLIFSLIALAVLGFAVFRFFSTNFEKRSRESYCFNSVLERTNYTKHMKSLALWGKRQRLKIKFFKTHRFRVCPCCKENLRISKRRGKREITCPLCGNKFTTHIWF